jgi:ppGpp synthetase/RelA/SpoT-type nucleotidyltranferase
MMNTDPITSFVARYRREYDFYYEAARLVSQQCDALAVENGIRAIVSFRAKSPERLEAKLNQRNPEKHYQTEDEIRSDIIDLSGARIALYFPGDRAKIAALLRSAFVVDQEKRFPDKPKADDHRFDGYHAEHYRVRISSDTLPEAQRRYGDSPVEIQVASVLMHAWSEVEHDLNYKQLSGQVSQEERSILDGINGIVLSGEIFLERLQAAFEARVSRSGSIFSNQYELAAFLYDRLRASMTATGPLEPVMGRIDILFRLLQRAGLDRPDDLPQYLQGLDSETERRPLADQVIDRILASRTELYDDYLEIRRTASSGARNLNVGLNYPPPEIVGSFLQKWIILERFDRALNRNVAGRRRIGLVSRNLLRELGVSDRLQLQFEVLRRVRNEMVHGVNIPEEGLLIAADAELGELLDALEANNDTAVREAMQWARSGAPDPPPTSPTSDM